MATGLSCHYIKAILSRQSGARCRQAIVFESEDGIAGPALVEWIDEEFDLVGLRVDWNGIGDESEWSDEPLAIGPMGTAVNAGGLSGGLYGAALIQSFRPAPLVTTEVRPPVTLRR